jgi:hypothetical protein
VRIAHRRRSSASTQELWAAAQQVKVGETGLLGRLIRWRIPGTTLTQHFSELFTHEPFIALDQSETWLVSGIVGRIWTLRRDYPALDDPEDFRNWSQSGTAKVVFANWASGNELHSEARVQALGGRGRLGLSAVRPLISSFHGLIGSEGIAAAVRRAERVKEERPGQGASPP